MTRAKYFKFILSVITVGALLWRHETDGFYWNRLEQTSLQGKVKLSPWSWTFQFVSDDNEHGRGVAINWKSYKKSEKIASLKADNFTEQVIDFEEGWPWYFITRDPNYPDAFEWKLNRGYTNSVGTGPKADRQVQTLVLFGLLLNVYKEPIKNHSVYLWNLCILWYVGASWQGRHWCFFNLSSQNRPRE